MQIIRGDKFRVIAAGLAVAAIAMLAALPATARPLPARSATLSTAVLESGVLAQLNNIRVTHGLVPLRSSATLAAAALGHTREMAAVGYFQHSSADGTAFWKRIQHWYPTTKATFWSVGENILWSAPDVDATRAMQLWMNSPEHRRNILDPTWREIGVAAVHVASAPGTYGNQPVTIVTTDFGVRR